MGRDADELEVFLNAYDEARARAAPALNPPGMKVSQKVGKLHFYTAEAAKAHPFSLKRSPYAGKAKCWPNLQPVIDGPVAKLQRQCCQKLLSPSNLSQLASNHFTAEGHSQ